jgi:hypothetical protein
MAISPTVVLEVQTGGNDTNGGGFDALATSAGTDYSQVTTKRTATGTNDSTTDAVSVGTTTITSATANFTNALIGNLISFSGGSGSLAIIWRQVVSVTNATTIVVDALFAAGTGITMNIGGCFASPGGAGQVLLLNGSNRIWIKAGTYTVTSATANISNGCFSKAAQGLKIEGYVTTRGDLGSPPPIMQANGSITSFTLIGMTNANMSLVNVDVHGNSRTSSKGVSYRGICYKVTAFNCTNNGFSTGGTNSLAQYCSATGCTTQPAFNGITAYNCVAYSNTSTGFTGGISYNRCISYNNSGATTDGFVISIEGALTINCVAYNNGRHGFSFSSTVGTCINNIAETNAGTGFITSGSTAPGIFWNNATYNNGTAFNLASNINNVNYGSITTASGTFFTNAAGHIFTLNSNANGGLLAKNAGIPGVFPGIVTSTGSIDLGATQGASGTSSGGEHSAVF